MAKFLIKLEKEDITTGKLGHNLIIQAKGMDIILSHDAAEELKNDLRVLLKPERVPEYKIPAEQSPLFTLQPGDQFRVTSGWLTHAGGSNHRPVPEFPSEPDWYVSKRNKMSIRVKAIAPGIQPEYTLPFRANQVMPMKQLKIQKL